MSTKKNKLSVQGLEKIFGNNVDNLIKEIEDSNKDFKKEYQIFLKISDIIPNPYQPRTEFNQEKLIQLSNSIEEHGVIQPILVKKSAINNNYYIIAGERRWRASKLAKKTEIPAIILDISEQKMHEYALIENIQRVDLNPIEESKSYSSLLKNFNINQEQLAMKLSKSAAYISNSLRLLHLPKSVQENILNNKLTRGHVKPLLAIENKKIVEDIANRIIKENWNVRQVEKYISNLNNKNQKNKKNNNDITTYLENKIIEKLGTKVKISNNKISISYNSVNDLNRILGILNLIEN